jgi:hypothetical protein
MGKVNKLLKKNLVLSVFKGFLYVLIPYTNIQIPTTNKEIIDPNTTEERR